jgi:low temperature requirement protein LtrA
MSATSESLLRQRDRVGDGKIAFVELLFGLVFVFTIIQLSHTLADHFTSLVVVAVWELVALSRDELGE